MRISDWSSDVCSSDLTHDIIRANLDRSPLFAGEITGVGPRYCPSLEDKVHRFADRDGHQIFLEPERLPILPSIATEFQPPCRAASRADWFVRCEDWQGV